MKLALIGLSLALCSPAHAGPDRVSLLLGSRHVGGSGFNEINPGAFLTWEDRAGGFDYTFGVYENSYSRTSITATVAAPLIGWDGGEVSAFAGLAHYPGDGRNFAVSFGDVVPIGGIQVRHENAFVQIIPSDGRHVDAVVSFGVTFKIGEFN